MTSDGWNSRTNHSYISVTLHFINNDWELKHFLLEAGEIIEQHTAVNLAHYSVEVIARWNLPATHISAVVTDNASNITDAIARLEWKRLGCFSHTLQVSLHKALNLLAVSRAIGQVKCVLVISILL